MLLIDSLLKRLAGPLPPQDPGQRLAGVAPAAHQILEIAKRERIVRPRDLATSGIAREHLIRLLRRGVLTRAARGIYTLAGAPVTEHHGLALVAKQAPGAVVCLLSALQFQGLTTQQPHDVWIAVGVKARKPVITWPAVRVVRFSGAALTEGVESRQIEGVPVRVYGIANSRMKDFYDLRTVAEPLSCELPTLSRSVRLTFERRRTPVPMDQPFALTPEFLEDANKRAQGQAIAIATPVSSAPARCFPSLRP